MTSSTLVEPLSSLKLLINENHGCTPARHPVFSGNAPEILQASPIKEIVVTNTIHLPIEKRIPKLTQLSVAPLFAEAIRRIYEELPVSKLFD